MRNEQILIVEDEPAIREMVVMTLEMAGFESLQAADVAEAHQQVVDHRPALILLDWMLPGDKSGIDFCRMLKSDALLAEIPVIMLTAKSEEDSKVHGLDAGADVIVLGSTTMHQAHAYLAEHLPVPVLNPGLIAYKMCEVLLDLGLCHSKIAYPSPEQIKDTAFSR